MSRLSAYRKTIKVIGISKNKDKFIDFIGKKHSFSSVRDRGKYITKHIRVYLEDGSSSDVSLFSTDTIVVTATPKADKKAFDSFFEDVKKCANSCIKSIKSSRPLALICAENLIEHVNNLDTNVDTERIVAVILSDTANEIVLREKLRIHRVNGSALDDGIPKKIERLKAKKEEVYRESEIIDVRDLRNNVVHKGIIPSKDQTIKVIEISSDFISKS